MKILIVKIGAIGDVIMALPMAREVRRRWPEAHVSWVCGKRVVELISACGVADELIVVDEARLARGVPSVLLKLGVRRFDLVVRAHRDVRYGALTLFRGRRWQPRDGVYHGEEYLRLVGGGELKWPEVALPEVDSAVDLVLAPGGMREEVPGRGLRMWQVERYAQLARRFAGRVAIVGSQDDLWVCDYFEGVDDCVGKLSILETIALMRKAKVVVTHDGGPLHMGVLSGSRVIGLFGPTRPKNFLPPSVESVWGGENLHCRPCYDGKFFANCSNAKCMQEISVDRVLEMI